MNTKLAWSTAICCLSLLFTGTGEAGQTTHNGQPIDPGCEYRDGPCVCYCPMVKYKPKYHCEKKCYTESYQVPKKCCRQVPQYYTKTYCRQVPEYYTKTHCRQVPEYYTVYETKYRKKYYTVNHCTYEPCKYVVKKCTECPTGCSTGNCSTGGCASGGCASNNYASSNRQNYQYAAKPSSLSNSQVAITNEQSSEHSHSKGTDLRNSKNNSNSYNNR